MLNIALWKAISLFMLGHTAMWFQLNSHLVFQWWKGKEVLAVFAFGVPGSLLFLAGWNIATTESGELWGPRFLAFCASWVPFTWRTIVCFLLACCILTVQMWR